MRSDSRLSVTNKRKYNTPVVPHSRAHSPSDVQKVMIVYNCLLINKLIKILDYNCNLSCSWLRAHNSIGGRVKIYSLLAYCISNSLRFSLLIAGAHEYSYSRQLATII